MTKHAMRAIAVAAIAFAATTASAIPAAGVDMSGTYFRAGPGFNATHGGAQPAFQLPATDFKSRLGNEADSYLEINFADTMYKDDNGVVMQFVFMPNADCGGHEWGNCNATTSVAQSFGLVKLPQLGGADIWIGNRYYQRHNIDNYDWFWWNVFQNHDAVGIENVDLGFGKLAFAIGRISVNGTTTATTTATPIGVTATGASVYPVGTTFTTATTGSDSYVVPDLRIGSIPILPGGTLELGVDLALSTGKGLTPGHSTVSPWFTAVYTQTGIIGGDNTLAFQYASGALAPMNNSTEIVGTNSDLKQWRVLDQLVFHPIPEVSGEFAAVFQSKSDNTGIWSASNTNILNLQLRPAYHVNNYFKIAADFWYSMLISKDNPGAGVFAGTSNPNLFKVTLAPTLVAGQAGGLWARPEFRVFATYATWSNLPAQAVAGGAFGTDTNGLTLGAQVEAWW
jgi:maltoporin